MNSSLSAPLLIQYLDFYGRLHPEETNSFAENGFSERSSSEGGQQLELANKPTSGHYNLLGSTWRAVGCPLEALCEDGEDLSEPC